MPLCSPLSPPCCRWRTAPSPPSSPKISAWFSTPATPSSLPPAPSATSSAAAACGLRRGTRTLPGVWGGGFWGKRCRQHPRDGSCSGAACGEHPWGVGTAGSQGTPPFCFQQPRDGCLRAEPVPRGGCRQPRWVPCFCLQMLRGRDTSSVSPPPSPSLSPELCVCPHRHAEASPACAGHLRGLRQGRGEPGRLAAPQRQPHPRPSVGAGEAQPAARSKGWEQPHRALPMQGHPAVPAGGHGAVLGSIRPPANEQLG